MEGQRDKGRSEGQWKVKGTKEGQKDKGKSKGQRKIKGNMFKIYSFLIF